MTPINLSIPTIAPAAGVASPGAASLGSTQSGGQAFSSFFSDAISKVESFQTNANNSVDKFLSGEGEELHKVALATQQADLSFQLFMQVRNKIVTAYNQVMQMQV